MTEHVFCQDALTQTLCRQGTFSFCGAEIGSKSVFERTRDNRKWQYLFSFQHTSKLTNLSLLSVFTLIMRDELPENLGKTTAPE